MTFLSKISSAVLLLLATNATYTMEQNSIDPNILTQIQAEQKKIATIFQDSSYYPQIKGTIKALPGLGYANGAYIDALNAAGISVQQGEALAPVIILAHDQQENGPVKTNWTKAVPTLLKQAITQLGEKLKIYHSQNTDTSLEYTTLIEHIIDRQCENTMKLLPQHLPAHLFLYKDTVTLQPFPAYTVTFDIIKDRNYAPYIAPFYFAPSIFTLMDEETSKETNSNITMIDFLEKKLNTNKNINPLEKKQYNKKIQTLAEETINLMKQNSIKTIQELSNNGIFFKNPETIHDTTVFNNIITTTCQRLNAIDFDKRT